MSVAQHSSWIWRSEDQMQNEVDFCQEGRRQCMAIGDARGMRDWDRALNDVFAADDQYGDMPNAQQITAGVWYYQTPRNPIWHTVVDGEFIIAMPHVQRDLDDGEFKYAEFMREQTAEMEMQRKTGRSICPKCGNRSVKTTSRYTPNYGGGTDTFEKCQTDGCDYAEVYV